MDVRNCSRSTSITAEDIGNHVDSVSASVDSSTISTSNVICSSVIGVGGTMTNNKIQKKFVEKSLMLSREISWDESSKYAIGVDSLHESAYSSAIEVADDKTAADDVKEVRLGKDAEPSKSEPAALYWPTENASLTLDRPAKPPRTFSNKSSRKPSFRCNMFGTIFTTSFGEGGFEADHHGRKSSPCSNAHPTPESQTPAKPESQGSLALIYTTPSSKAPATVFSFDSPSPMSPAAHSTPVDQPLTSKLFPSIAPSSPLSLRSPCSPYLSKSLPASPFSTKLDKRYNAQTCCSVCLVDGTSTFCLRCRHFCTYL